MQKPEDRPNEPIIEGEVKPIIEDDKPTPAPPRPVSAKAGMLDNLGDRRQLIIQVAIAFIVTFGLIYFQVNPSIINLDNTVSEDMNEVKIQQASLREIVVNNTNQLTTHKDMLAGLETELTSQADSLDTQIQAKVTAQVQAQTNNLATKESVSNLSDDVRSIQTTVNTVDTSLNTKIQELKTTNTALETRIKALEDKATATTTSSTSTTTTEENSGLMAKLVVFDEEFVTDSTNKTRIEFKFSIENTSVNDLTDIIYEIPLYLDHSGALMLDVDLSVDGVGTWDIRNQTNHNIVLRNSRMTLLANTKKAVYFTLDIQFDKPAYGYVDYSGSDIELVSWDYR